MRTVINDQLISWASDIEPGTLRQAEKTARFRALHARPGAFVIEGEGGQHAHASAREGEALAARSLEAERKRTRDALDRSRRAILARYLDAVITAAARMRARGLRPSASPMALLPISTAAAPSTIPELLPA